MKHTKLTRYTTEIFDQTLNYGGVKVDIPKGVRVTDNATGRVVACDYESTAHKNRSRAIKTLEWLDSL
jgi:protein subunit release factor A